MKLSLKDIILNLSQSLSSHCFTATLWIDGHKCFDIKDEGFGEPIIYQTLESAHIELNALIEHLNQQSELPSKSKSHYQCLDQCVTALVDEYIQDLKSQHQLRRITFVHSNRLYLSKTHERVCD